MKRRTILLPVDLIVTKCGYSTIYEAVRAGVPLCLYQRNGFAEDANMIDFITAEGLGHEIT